MLDSSWNQLDIWKSWKKGTFFQRFQGPSNAPLASLEPYGAAWNTLGQRPLETLKGPFEGTPDLIARLAIDVLITRRTFRSIWLCLTPPMKMSIPARDTSLCRRVLVATGRFAVWPPGLGSASASCISFEPHSAEMAIWYLEFSGYALLVL